MREKQIRVLIADDQAVIRVGLRAILEAGGLAVCGEAAGGHEALAGCGSCAPMSS